MKNLRLFKLLFLLFCINSFGQNLQNANWIFGNRDALNNNNLNNLNFNLNPSVQTSNQIYNNLEGCATVSDQSGNLLFTTNGVQVFGFNQGSNSFYLITDQLLGHISSTQNVIIVPKPKDDSRFYVFTIDGFTGQRKGLYYTELDFSSGTGAVVSGTLNTQLNNSDGTPLNVAFNNLSEGITSTEHSDGQTYWVVAHVQNSTNFSGRILSYHVTENGVVGGMPAQNVSFHINNGTDVMTRHMHAIKISPNSTKIGFANSKGLVLSDFDKATGVVTGTTNFINSTINTEVYGLEFSPNSNFVYYDYKLQGDAASQNVFRLDVSTLASSSISFASNFNTHGMQLGVDGRIYITTTGGSTPVLFTITSPNTTTQTNFNTSQLSINAVSGFGLPQWVHWYQIPIPPCLYAFSLASPLQDVNSGVDNRQASHHIIASNIIQVNGQAVYHAGSYVDLHPGFETVLGSKFRADPVGCTNLFPYKVIDVVNDEEVVDVDNSNNLIKNKITIYPNPTNSLVNVSYNHSKFNQVNITSMEGRVVYIQKMETTNSSQFDISNFQNGIYTLSIMTVEGTILNEKLIKN